MQVLFRSFIRTEQSKDLIDKKKNEVTNEHGDEMTSQDFQQLHKYEMTREKFEATQLVCQTFNRTFSFKKMATGLVTAFKSGLVDIYKQSQKSNRPDSKSSPEAKEPTLGVQNGFIVLGKNEIRIKTLNINKKGTASQKQTTPVKKTPSSKQSVRSFRGKFVDEDSKSSEIQTREIEGSGFANKNDILDSYIDEQKKINEMHVTLVRNKLQDQQQQFNMDQEDSDYSSQSAESSAETSSLQDF